MSNPWPHLVVLIVPANLQEIANAIGRSLDPDSGGGHTFGIPLPSAAAPTHYGALTAAAASFVQIIQAIQGGQADLYDLVCADYAARWPEITPPRAEECAEFLTAAVIRIDEGWNMVLEELGLVAADEYPR